jgi:hypothetical protein
MPSLGRSCRAGAKPGPGPRNTVFDWLGKHAPLEGDVSPDAELIAACEQWLAAAAVADDSPDVGSS